MRVILFDRWLHLYEIVLEHGPARRDHEFRSRHPHGGGCEPDLFRSTSQRAWIPGQPRLSQLPPQHGLLPPVLECRRYVWVDSDEMAVLGQWSQ